MRNDIAEFDTQRMEACPPQLRTKLMRQFRMRSARESASSRYLDEVLTQLLSRWERPPENAPTSLFGQQISLTWHRRRWLP